MPSREQPLVKSAGTNTRFHASKLTDVPEMELQLVTVE
jgi:hypothetical protein